MPWASRLLKISRSPALGMTGTISKPVVSGFQGSRLAGCVFLHSSKRAKQFRHALKTAHVRLVVDQRKHALHIYRQGIERGVGIPVNEAG